MSDRDTAFDLLATNWDRPPMTPERSRIYARYLKDIADHELLAAVETLLGTHETWRPDIARIRRAVVEARHLFPTEGEAARSAHRYIELRNLYAGNGSLAPGQEDWPLVHPVVCEAAEAAGVEHEASFVKAYREAVAKATTAIQTGDLSEPALYTPARIPMSPHRPPQLVWARRADTGTVGWHSPAGKLVHGDRGGHRQALPATVGPLALPFPT